VPVGGGGGRQQAAEDSVERVPVTFGRHGMQVYCEVL
jgi:hypothetical protein